LGVKSEELLRVPSVDSSRGYARVERIVRPPMSTCG
jgi:hypothetical protein